MVGAPSPEVVLGPRFGVDFAALRVGGQYLIVASDPVTGVEEGLGWYAVNVCANDVATSGTRPRFLEVVLLFPEDADEALIETVSSQVHQAARELGIAVVGGHTELTPGLKRPIVVATAFTYTARYISAQNARVGDLIAMTKTVAIEGTSILARALGHRLREAGVSPDLIEEGSRMRAELSVVAEAEAAFGTGGVRAMHDTTEGGLLGAVSEMAEASGTGFHIYEERVPVAPATRAICQALRVDPLRLIGSGSLLMALDPARAEAVLQQLRGQGYQAAIIGEFTAPGERSLTLTSGRTITIEEVVVDELWRLAGEGGL
jgi:hydrogenase maturation factor